MANPNLLEELAARVLEVDPDASDDEVTSAFRSKSSDWHPDVSDEPDAREKFIAAQAARDVLTGDIDYADPDQVNTARSNLSELFSESEVDELSRQTESRVGYQSSAETRSDPGEYSRADFVGADPQEKREMMKEVALGVETVIVFQSVEGMYETGYAQDDFFADVNEYIGEARADQIDFSDYYNATKENLREEVTEQLFVNSCEKIQENLQAEYGAGTNIREVARIVAHFVVQGGITIGDVGRFVGGGAMGGDERFTRSHPLGRHGRTRRSDRRYTRGGDRYERR